MAKIVVYISADEVLITTKANELQFLEEYGFDRDWDEYDRVETEKNRRVVRIVPSSTLNIE